MPEQPFTPDEDRVWRALIRVSTILPRALDDELEREARVSLTEFAALLHLTEAGEDGMRMSDLAAATGLSPSRITRVVSEMLDRGWAEKSRAIDDARSNLAVITPLGEKQLRHAYPVQVNHARQVFFNHLQADEWSHLAGILEELVQRISEPSELPIDADTALEVGAS